MKSKEIKKVVDSNFKRISSALIGFPLVAAIIIIGNKYVVSIGLAIIACLAMNEYLNAISKKANPVKWISYLSCLAISLLSIVSQQQFLSIMLSAIFIILLILFSQVIFTGMKTNFNDLVYTFMGIIYIVFFTSTMVMVRGLENGKILIWYIFIAGWATDIFAYIIGRHFGKHKFSVVSPKKSIEGCIAGTLGALLLSIIFTYFINLYAGMQYSYLYTSIITVVLSLIGQIGDFAASTIKRYVDIKDYSNLIPGHGGILDRLDSTIAIMLGYLILYNLF